jgi:hypothetical protein
VSVRHGKHKHGGEGERIPHPKKKTMILSKRLLQRATRRPITASLSLSPSLPLLPKTKTKTILPIVSSNTHRCFSSSQDSANGSSGISFSLSEEQKELQELARSFTAKEIIPNAAHHDRTGEYPTEILKKVSQTILQRSPIPLMWYGDQTTLSTTTIYNKSQQQSTRCADLFLLHFIYRPGKSVF